jgi:hypothetical protein
VDAEAGQTMSISSPISVETRLLGSRGGIEQLQPSLSRRPRDDDDPGPDPDEDPVPPPPPVSAPDVALQFRPCLEEIPLPNVDLRAAVLEAVQTAFGAGADVRYDCVSGKGTLGIWLRPVASPADGAARDRGLQRVNILQGVENFAVFINASLIRRNAQAAWESTAKRLDGNGRPDPDGPVHLTGMSLTFRSPDQVIVNVDGYDERPWPDVDFRLAIADTLAVAGGSVQCATSRDLDVDTSWLNFLTGVFLFVLPPLGIFFLVENILVRNADAPNAGAGAGCSAAALIPDEILIPGGQKVVAFYNRVAVSSGGIFAGGTAAPVARVPAVAIQGPTQRTVEAGKTTVTGNYRVVTDDLLAPLQITWSGEGTPVPQGSAATTFRFNVAGAAAGQTVSKRVAVRVTDRDGLTARSEALVRIHVTDPDDDIPPICRKKPWLPQCQEV